MVGLKLRKRVGFRSEPVDNVLRSRYIDRGGGPPRDIADQSGALRTKDRAQMNRIPAEAQLAQVKWQ